MEIILFLLLLIYIKLFLFWLWLWQLKEYHLGRFLAHFKEGQAIRKILPCLWWLKYPKFTKKIAVISFTGFVLAVFMFDKGLYFYTPFLIILVPLLFQIPTVIWRKGFFKKAKLKRARFKNLLVIGITGSYGKTSTKDFLYAILAEKFGKDKVLKSKEHQNSEVGIARCILNELRPEHEIFIVEMGAYNVGGIKMLCDMIHPKIGILTGINEQHMATFGSQENIIKGKYELIESLPADGIAFFNARNKYCVELYNKTGIRKYLYSQDAKIFGEENLLGARAVAKELGVMVENGSLPKFLSVKQGINRLNIIDSTYSANPTGVIAHLDYLKTLPAQRDESLFDLRYRSVKKVLVMPCLIELGRASKEVHQRIGAKIAQVCDLAIITTKDRFKEIKEMAGDKVVFIDDPKEIFNRLKSATQSGDVVLLEGRVPNQLISLLYV